MLELLTSGSIKTKEDFLGFMERYIPTVADSAVRDYLESIAGWTADMEGYYKNTGKEMPENINWELMAVMLYVGSIYE